MCFGLLSVQCHRVVVCEGLSLWSFQTHRAQKCNSPWPPEPGAQNTSLLWFVPAHWLWHGEPWLQCAGKGCSHWSEQARRWCDNETHQLLAPTRQKENTKIALASAFILRVPVGFCFCGRCFKINKWVSFVYSLGAFQTVASVLCSRMSGFMYKPFKSRFFFPCSHLVLLEVNTVGF